MSDQTELINAIKTAIQEGFASIKSSGPSDFGSLNTNTSTPPPPSNETNPVPSQTEIAGISSELNSANQQTEKFGQNWKRAAGISTGIAGGMMKLLGDGIKTTLDGLGAFNAELDEELFLFRKVQKAYGGISEAAYASGEAVEGLGGQAMRAFQNITMASTGATDAAFQIESGAMQGRNAMIALFRDPLEAANLFMSALEEINHENIAIAKSLEAQGAAEEQRIAVIMKRMSISSSQMGDMLKRQYAFTKEASADIFGDIANVSVTLANTVGGSAEDLKNDILDIMQDTKLFGDIGVDSAGRIAASLNQLGLDFQTFKSMTSQFMDFDNAAQKMGDLSALFGIQMDAMEMTYLANEDQEEFLFRMREEILDAGLDVENMSKTRQRALTEQLGLSSIEQMRQFMDTGIQPDQMAMEAATESAKTMDGMATAVEQFGAQFEGATRGAAEFEKSLRLQSLMTDKVAQGIAKVRIEAGKLPDALQSAVVVSDAAKDNALRGLSADLKMVGSGVKDTLTMMAEVGSKMAEMGAEMTGGVLDVVGLTPLGDGVVEVGGKVEHDFSPETKEQAKNVVNAAQIQTERSAEQDNKILELANNQMSQQGDMTSLIETLRENKNINMSISLNANQMSSELWKVIQEKYGGNIVINPTQ